MIKSLKSNKKLHLRIGDVKFMRVPLVYSASEINRWHISEQFQPGKWRPARCCGFWTFRHVRQQLRVAWRVLIGRYDALNWGDGSGESAVAIGAAYPQYADCTQAEFFSATRVHFPAGHQTNQDL